MKKERVARKERLALQVGIALTAGVFGTLPTAEGAPVLDKVVTAGTQVAQSGSITDVTGTQQNNIVKWTDFSVNQGETVRFDKGAQEKNYLNLVTGPKTSEIAGSIEGGKDVYLVNPHGVIFHQGAQVNVGNLYVSTENTDAALAAFNAGKTPGEVLKAGTENADVVNLGGIAASSVIVNGDTIRFLIDNVQAQDVTLQAAKSVVKEQTATQSASTGVLRAAALAAKPSYVLRAPSVSNKIAILDATGLVAMNQNLSGDYSLEADLTLSGTYTPIGGNSYGAFTGKFDGNFHSISGMQVSGVTYGGLFGLTSSATIQNVGVRNGSVKAAYAGGIVGQATSSALEDVYNAGVSVASSGGRGSKYKDFSVGGIAGVADGGTIKKAYNTGVIAPNARGAGLVGVAVNSFTLEDAYNIGEAKYGVIGFSNQDTTPTVKNVYTTQKVFSSDSFGGKLTNVVNIAIDDDSAKKASTYTNFVIDSNGTNDAAVWRIYEGHSLPLLRDFLRRGKGAVTVSYDYVQGDNKGTINGSDLTLTYNNQDVKLSNINYTNANGLLIDKSKITQDIDGLHDANRYSDKDGSSSNGRLAFYCTSQDGYDLVGDNIYIDQRTVNISGADISDKTVEKVYDGGADASAAVAKLFTGDSTSVSGIIAGDDSIKLDTNAVNAYFIDSKGNQDASVGANKDVWVDGTISIKNADGKNNYKIDPDKASVSLQGTTIKGTITQKDIVVDFASGKGTGIDKTYDGASTVADAYKPSNATFSYADQIIKKTGADGTPKAEDAVLTYEQDANYVAADLKTKEKGAGSYQNRVQYSGLKLTGSDAQNYRLVDKSGNVLWDVKTNGTGEDINKDTGGSLYGSGAINKRNFSSAGFSWYKKDGTKQDAVREYTHESGYTEPVGSLVDTERVSSAAADKQGLITGDDVKFIVTGAEFTTSATDAGASATYNVKDAKGVRYQVDISGADVANYTMDGKEIASSGTVSGEGHITPRTLNVVAGKGVDKVYDGTSDVVQATNSANPLVEGWVTYGDNDAAHQLITGDDSKISLMGSHYAGSDVIYDKDGNVAAQNITYEVSVLQDGEDKGNYVFSSSSKTTADLTKDANGNAVQGKITPAPITSLIFQKVSKTYDASEDVRGKQKDDKIDITGGTWLKGNDKTEVALSADDVKNLLRTDNITGKYGHKKADGTFEADEHARNGEQKDVRYTGIELQNEKGNYILSLAGNDKNGAVDYGKGNINPLTIDNKDALVLEQTQAITKIYDHSTAVGDRTHKNTDYVGKLTAKVSDDVDADTIELGYKVQAANYYDWNRGENKGVTYQLDVTPDENGDYTLADSLKTNGYFVYDKIKGTITPRHLTAKVIKENIEKVYDGTRDVIKTDTGGTTTKVAPDELVSFAATSGGEGIIAGDTVTNATKAAYKDENAGKPGITYTFALGKNEAGNYVLDTASADGKGTITPREVTVSFDPVDKPYDGNQNITGDKYTLGNIVTKDTKALELSYNKSYENPNVNSAKNPNWANYTNLRLAGTAAKNYKLSVNATTGVGTIYKYRVTKGDISVDFDPITKVYDGNRNVSYQHTAADYPDQAGVADQLDYIKGFSIHGISLGYGTDQDYTLADDALYNSKDVASANSATYHFKLSKMVLNNFDFSGLNDGSLFDTESGILTKTTSASITPKTVTAALSGVADVISKTYDGKIDLLNGTDVSNRVTFAGLLAGDENLGKTTGVYDGKDVARDADGNVITKNIIYTPSLDGKNAGNYALKLVSGTGGTLASKTLMGENQGRIHPRQLDFAADYAEREFDGTADAKVKNGRFTEVRDAQGQTVADTGLVSGENLTPGTDVKAQYGSLQHGVFVADGNVNGEEDEEDYKGIRYEGLQQALRKAAGQSDDIKASNYTIADTKYFDEAKKQGKIKRLALSAGDIKTRWKDVVKQYDGTTAVESPEEKFLIYINEVHRKKNGKDEVMTLPNEIHLRYDLKNAAYNAAGAGKASSVTYEVSGLKNSDKLKNNFTFTNPNDELDLAKYQGRFTLTNDGKMWKNGVQSGTSTAKVGITKRVLNGRVTSGHNDKVYNGETAADSSFLVLTAGTDGKSAAKIAAMLEEDGTTFGNLVQANYIDAQGHADASASTRAADHDATRQGTKQVRYTLRLTDALKDNYTVDKDDTTKTETSYDGYGDIFKRVVYVDFANDKEDNKTYDGYDDVKKPLRTFALSDEQGDTGIIKADQDQGKVHLDTGNITGKYASAHVKRAEDGTPVAQQVSYRGFGVDNANYEVRAKAADGADSDTLVGMGKITPATLHVSLKDEKVTKVYDNTLDLNVKDKALAKYGEANIQKTEDDLKTVNNVRDTVNVTLVDKSLPQYDKKDANVIKGKQTKNRSVTYDITWDNPDYDLALAQGAPSQTLTVTKAVVSSKTPGTAHLVTDAATITPRTVTISADPLRQATRLYDGKSGGAADDAIENLKADNLAEGEKLINLFLKPGATKESYLPETVLQSAYDSDPNAGKDGIAIGGNGNDLREHTVTYTYTLQNPNYQLDAAGTMDGKAFGTGVIRRRDLVLAADPQTMQEGGALPQYTGTIPKGAQTGFVPEDAASEADFLRDVVYAPSAQHGATGAAEPDALFSPQAGRYGIYGWYRVQTGTQTIPAHEVTGADGSVVSVPEATVPVYAYYRNGNYGTNYMFHQAPANGGALRVERPEQQLPSFGDLDGLNPDRHFRPDRGSYNHATHDELGSATRAPRAGLEYAAGGINAGAAEDAPHGEVSLQGEAQLRGEAEVVNLGASGAQRVDLTTDAAGFILTGDDAVRTAPPRIEERTAPVQPEHEADASAAVPRVSGEAPAAGTGDALLWGDSLPAAAASSTTEAPAAGAEDALLWGDSFPAAAASSTAEAPTLFDDGAGAAAGGAPAVEAGDLPLFDDVPGASPAPSKEAERPADDAISVTTDTTTDDGAGEDAQDSAPQREKNIAIESEGAGVNLAG